MNAREKSKVLKELNLPEYFTIKGGSAYYFIKKDDYVVLVQVLIDHTSSKERFRLYHVMQPLYVPSEYLHIDVGYEIDRFLYVEDIPKIKAEVGKIIFPSSLEDVNKALNLGFVFFRTDYKKLTRFSFWHCLYAWYRRFNKEFPEAYNDSLRLSVKIPGVCIQAKGWASYEFLGLNYFILGKYDLAKKELLRGVLPPSSNAPQWAIDNSNRAKDFIELLDAKKYEEARAKLLEWQAYTLAHVKLTV